MLIKSVVDIIMSWRLHVECPKEPIKDWNVTSKVVCDVVMMVEMVSIRKIIPMGKNSKDHKDQLREFKHKIVAGIEQSRKEAAEHQDERLHHMIKSEIRHQVEHLWFVEGVVKRVAISPQNLEVMHGSVSCVPQNLEPHCVQREIEQHLSKSKPTCGGLSPASKGVIFKYCLIYGQNEEVESKGLELNPKNFG